MTYVYYCPICDIHFDVILDHFMTEAEEDKKWPCPTCKTEATYKVFNVVNVIYRGSGWANKKD